MKRFNTNQINEIVQEIINGKVAIVPTDTVMGLVGLNFVKIANIKHRELTKKQIIFISSLNPLVPLKNKLLRGLVNAFWPGKLTVIVDGVSYRMPNSLFLLNLISLTGNLYSTSANLAGQSPITDYESAQTVFSDHLEDLIFVDDDKTIGSKTASTIVDLDQMKLIRAGEIVNHPTFQKLAKKYGLAKLCESAQK